MAPILFLLGRNLLKHKEGEDYGRFFQKPV